MKNLILKTIKAEISDAHFNNQIGLWNEFFSDAYIYYSIREYAELNAGYITDPLEIARMVKFGNLDNWDDALMVGSDGNFQSVYELPDLDMLANAIFDQANFSVMLIGTFGDLEIDLDYFSLGDDMQAYYQKIADAELERLAEQGLATSRDHLLQLIEQKAKIEVIELLIDL